MYQPTTALKKIAALTKSTRVVQGGQGAGKTIGIEMILANHALHSPNKEITIIQAELSKLKKTALRDFIKILKSYGLFDPMRWNKTDSIYTFPNGTYIEFLGLDKADVGKGFRRDILYFNEINKGGITLDAYMQFASRARINYVDFNPDRYFWLHDEIIPDKDTDFLILTHSDNEYLPKNERKAILKYKEKGFFDLDKDCTGKDESNIKSKYWSNKWIVYGLGLVGKLEGVILTDWDIIQNIPPDAKYLCTGNDFGFTNDPSVAIDLYKYKDEIILDEIYCMKGMSSKMIAEKLKEDINRDVFSDVDPRTISEVRAYGVRIRQATKGPGSVELGLDIMQQRRLRPTARSKNLINSLKNYSWATDKNGEFINKPNHDYSDPIDATRYGFIMKLKNNQNNYNYSIL